MPEWTPAEAAALASKGGKARARQLKLSPEERAVEAVRSKAPDLMRELLAAAMGAGDFEGIKAETRVSAILRALEYGIGRPAPAVKAKPEVVETTGLTLA